MICNFAESLMPMNMVDGVDFTANDPCVWVLHTPGACGDLIASIINSHYVNAGCDYFGINDSGQVKFLPADYKLLSRSGKEFNDDFFYGVADNLGNRNLNYSLLDNIIFTSHEYNHDEIINTFPKGKIINITHETQQEKDLINAMSVLKNSAEIIRNDNLPRDHTQILNIHFSDIFKEESFEELYSRIISFLGLPCKLIRYNYIEFYISKQIPDIQLLIRNLNK